MITYDKPKTLFFLDYNEEELAICSIEVYGEAWDEYVLENGVDSIPKNICFESPNALCRALRKDAKEKRDELYSEIDMLERFMTRCEEVIAEISKEK